MRLLEVPPPEESAFLSQLYSTVENDYITARSRLYDARNSLAPPQSHSQNIDRVIPAPAPSHGPRLPRISIPSFSGKREDWESFRDLFRALIHEDGQLTDVERLFYLKSLVEGDAKAALDTIQIANANYSTAWALLEARFDHRRLLVHDHITALRNIKPLKEESARGVQSLVDTLERHRDQLRALGRPVLHWDDWLISCALTGMDPTTRRAWEDEVEKLESTNPDPVAEVATFAALTSFLRRRCRSLNSVEASHSACPAPMPKTRPAASSSSGRNYRTFVTSGPLPPCPICNEAHYVGHCSQFQGLNLRERKDIIYHNRLCFNCLKSGHAVKFCPSSSLCQHCGEPHHSLLHDSRRIRQRDADPSGDSKSSKQPKLSVTHPPLGDDQLSGTPQT